MTVILGLNVFMGVIQVPLITIPDKDLLVPHQLLVVVGYLA
jgi:hypothetical protein